MISQRCNKYTDCASCEYFQKHIFKFRFFPKGMVLPKERCLQNTIYFLLKGKVLANSEEHPDTIFHQGQFILQSINSKVEFRILEATECILYLFDRPQNVCNERFRKGYAIAENSDLQPIILNICPPLDSFLQGLKMYLNDDMKCAGLLHAKRVEMVYLLNCYYPLNDLAAFYSPIYRYSKSFRYFIMQNYQKVKDVETFARLGGYSVPTFRRIFKETFGEPAYQWMLKKKCQDIENDLKNPDIPISEICYKYDFESLSNFSHFCRTNFGLSPRALRAKQNENK